MKKILVLALALLPMSLFAQYGETIRTARPGQAIGAFALGKKVFQMQTGYNFNEQSFTPYLQEEVKILTTTNTTVLRLGITEKIELSGLINWQTRSTSLDDHRSNIGGISDTQIGGRINLLENDGWIPTVGLQARLLLKIDRGIYRREDLGHSFVLATGNRITDRISLATNYGMVWLGDGSSPKNFYVVNVGYSINDKFGTFVEAYGTRTDDSINFDTGLSYLVNKDFQLDISGGWQGDNTVADWFVDFGISWRFDWRNKS